MQNQEGIWQIEKQGLQDRCDVAEVARDNASAQLSLSQDAVAVLKSDLEASRASHSDMWTKAEVQAAAKRAEDQLTAQIAKKTPRLTATSCRSWR